MSKRTDSIRSMFSVPQAEALSADNKPTILPRMSAGSVRSLRDTFSDVEKENEELRARLASGQFPVDLDPNLIDSSPLADRFVEQDAAAFEALKTSIRERGQEIPVLVRRHPDVEGRYQSAYGHRRIRAAKELGATVRAYVRALSEEELVVAQGLENSAREDLSFIERAVFASRLEDAGFERTVTQTALSVDRAEVSKLIAVARAIPADVVEAIGRAPKVGRGRWQVLADAMKNGPHLKRARAVIKGAGFAEQSSEARFSELLSAANKSSAARSELPDARSISSTRGDRIASVAFTDGNIRLTVSRTEHEGFAAYLIDKIPELFDAYAANVSPEQQGEG
jgi:ParB family chromosome partitioning protein